MILLLEAILLLEKVLTDTLEDLSIREDNKDVIEMAKHMASCSQNQGHINLSTVTTERLQALVLWIHDHQS